MTVLDGFVDEIVDGSVMFPAAENLRTFETILGLDGETFTEPQTVKYALVMKTEVRVRLVGEDTDRTVARRAQVTLCPPF